MLLYIKISYCLYGISIVWIVLFHFKAFDTIPLLSDVVGFGELGVDIFLFLSAFGLCNSFEGNKNVRVFYLKRIIRIIPVWLFF